MKNFLETLTLCIMLLFISDSILTAQCQDPIFEKCRGLNSIAETIDCNDEQMYQFVFEKIYPEAKKVKRKYLNSEMKLQINIDSDRKMNDVHVMENPGRQSGESIIKTTLNIDTDQIGIPGYIASNNNSVTFTLPNDIFEDPDDSKIQLHCHEFEIFKVVEIMPTMPGCETLGDKEQRDCKNNKLREYIYSYTQYPEVFKIAGNKGELVLQFIVEKDGSMSQAKVVRDIGFGMGKAVRDAIKKMNEEGIRMIPGKQRNRNVTVLLTFPITFDPAKTKK